MSKEKIQIRFGPGGFGMPPEKAMSELKEDGLFAGEIEFTYGVNLTNEHCKKIGEIAKKNNIQLSVHAPYYINLNSEDKRKIFMSKKRILDSCERAHNLGAKYVVFHPAFYGKDSRDEVYERVKKEINYLHEKIKENKWDVKLAPETTGKESQFGDIDELIKLHKETGCFICVDFAHLKARYNGKINYDLIFQKLKIEKITEVHCHFSGIEFTVKGERKHLVTSKENWNEILPLFKKHNFSGTIINESPDNWNDSIKGKKLWDELNK